MSSLRAAAPDPAWVRQLSEYRARIEERLDQLVPEGAPEPPALNRALRYGLIGGGKRIRPLLALATAEQLGGRACDALDPACAIEMVHAASLIIDDMPAMDDATLRRGRLAAHRAFGEDVATLAAFELLNRAFAVTAGARGLDDPVRLRLVSALSRAVGGEGLIGGQLVDLELSWRRLEAPELLELYGRKTGALFAVAMEAGARAAAAPEAWIEPVRRFALGLGLSFQICDDLLDCFGTRADAGKDVGQDDQRGTFVSRFGSRRARTVAGELLERACEALEPLGASGPPLADLGRRLLRSASAPAHRPFAPRPVSGMGEATAARKDAHLRVCIDENVDVSATNGSPFEVVRLPHRALPELDRSAIDTSIVFLGKRLELPLLVGSMTGGTEEARRINRRLAEAAQRCGVGMCLGSQRILLERPEAADTFRVRDVAPDVLLVSNLGAVQLRLGASPEQARALVDAVGADALVFHLNPAQEAVQEEGETAFSGIASALERAIPRVGVPCGVKEVGCGFAPEDVALLSRMPLSFLESAGRGGTSWTRVEGLRGSRPATRVLGELFAEWGHSSVESLTCCIAGAGEMPVVASGGLRSGLDAARALALGATVTAMALPLLRAATESVEAVVAEIELFRESLVTAMFLTGAADLAALRRLKPELAPSDPLC